MKCPKCNSEDIHFVKNTSGKDFSFGNACCGSIVLGPFGWLCGACGSGKKTEEFWICKNCGHKFKNWEGQLNQGIENLAEKIDANNYEKNRQIRDDALQKYGSVEKIKKLAHESDNRLEDLTKKHEELKKSTMDEVASHSSDEIKRLQKKSEPSCLGIILFLALAGIGIIRLLANGFGDPVVWITLGGALAWFVITAFITSKADDKIKEKLEQESEHYKELSEQLEKEKVENKVLELTLAAIYECDRYEQENKKGD